MSFQRISGSILPCSASRHIQLPYIPGILLLKLQDTLIYGILEIGVFGSVAREEVRENSDVDVVVRISKPDLFMLVGIKDELEERLHRSVDIVTYRENMNSQKVPIPVTSAGPVPDSIR